MAPDASPSPDRFALAGGNSSASVVSTTPAAELTTQRTYAADPRVGSSRGYAFFFVAVALLGLSLPWLEPLTEDGRNFWPLVASAFCLYLAAATVQWSRFAARYRFTITPSGFHETPRHGPGEEARWSRVARISCRAFRPTELELRDARGDVMGTLSFVVAGAESAIDAVIERVSPSPSPLPATFRWPTRYLYLLLLVAGGTFLIRLGVTWLQEGNPNGGLLISIVVADVLLSAIFFVRRRTAIDADGVTVCRGLGRRTLRWRDVSDVTLERVAWSIEVVARLSNGRTVAIRPTDGDLIGVLVTARAAHGGTVAREPASADR